MTIQQSIQDESKLEKVVSGLELCSPGCCTRELRKRCPYYGGPETEYWSNPDGYGCEWELRNDAIKLLQAQYREIDHLRRSLDSMSKIMTEK